MKVFLSSTAKDLDAYRKVAEDVILKLSQQIDAMEYFGALPGTPSDECERLARESDVIVCILAHRYGSGITRREVEAAHEAGKDVLAWIVSDDFLWTGIKETDRLGDRNVFSDPAKAEEVRKGVEALGNFKAWLQERFTTDTFTTPEDLGGKIAIALSRYVKRPPTPPISQDKISIARLPTTGANLFGREAELQLLDNAWASPNTHIVSFVAWGGVGKTALVNHWLKRRMARDNYRGAERVYGWSFFSQGTKEGGGSADLFIDQALRWFGDADPTAGSPWEKGARLAHYIRQSPTLLILDGLEPLQYPPGSQEGRLKDAALQTLLVELAAQQSGLCVISTRERVGDLVEFEDGTVIQYDLERLSPQAGAQTLRSFNVTGDDHELEEAANELGGHAFSLTLLGSYLDEVLNGDIRRRREIEDLFHDSRFGDAAQRMIAAYEKWLGEGMELAILRLLGLFDHPADLLSIEALRRPPVIKGLTEPLQHFKGREWNQAVAKLRRIRLLAEASPSEPGTLDAHPLIREHFKRQLKEKRPSWLQANDRLYEHLSTTTKQFPDSLVEITRLYSALEHRYQAGRVLEAFQFYWSRIARGEAFAVKKLGAFAAELAAIACFFEVPWKRPLPGMPEHLRGFLVSHAGNCLSALGRLQEAADAMKAGFEMWVSNGSDENSAIIAANLSDLYVGIGDLERAVNFAKKGVELSNPSNHIVQKYTRAALANVFHQTGQVTEALDLFRQAEESQKKHEPRYLFLYSISGFWYCDFLIAQGELQQVRERATLALESSKKEGHLLSIALDYLSLAQLSFIEAQKSDPSDVSEAAQYLEHAVVGLRRAGVMNEIPRGLLARAEIHRFVGDFENAQRDLDEVRRIAKRSGMALFLADYYLASARLNMVQEKRDEARRHLALAKDTIESVGYHRRDKEVQELEAQLA